MEDVSGGEEGGRNVVAIVAADSTVIGRAAVRHSDIVTRYAVKATIITFKGKVERVEVQPHYLSGRHHYGPLYVFVVAVITYNICVI